MSLNLKSDFLEEVRAESSAMRELLSSWVSVNSGSGNESGLLEMLEYLSSAFSELRVEMEKVPCEGQQSEGSSDSIKRYALRVRPKVVSSDQKPILLNGHYDTVYGPESSFQNPIQISDTQLRGPGVTDMKGGLVVLFTALKIWERSEYQGRVAWEVLITPDEEIGSEASDPLLRDAAERCAFGLVYESSYVDGGFVRRRKGSAVYRIAMRGRSAHVGRNYEDGRNAILGLAEAARSVQMLASELSLIANVGVFQSDSPLNVVPDEAVSMWNVRASTPEEFAQFEVGLDQLKHEVPEGFELNWSGGVMRPAKTVSKETQRLYDAVERTAGRVGLPVSWRDTGGGADGSNLAAYGLPNIDNLGVRGGAIHSEDEFVELESLEERVCLTLAILQSVAEGDFMEGIL